MQIGSGPAAVIPALRMQGQRNCRRMPLVIEDDQEGRQGRESQKTCRDVSRTVFGVKILCGLMAHR